MLIELEIITTRGLWISRRLKSILQMHSPFKTRPVCVSIRFVVGSHLLIDVAWHDTSMTMMGPSVVDLIQHFCERWNFVSVMGDGGLEMTTDKHTR